jgi:NADH-quinone oxidoreductase subunit M
VINDGLSPAWLVAVPFAGAAAGFALWSKPQALKIWTLIVSLATLAGFVAISDLPAGPPAGLLLPCLLPATALLSLLGQPAHRESRAAWLMTLVLLGLGLGALAGMEGIGLISRSLLLGLLGALLYRYRHVSGSVPWWGIATCGIGLVGVLAGAFAPPPVSTIALAAACATLLPLAPFHGGYVAAFRGLPANLPAFVALLLPVLGFHGLLILNPRLSAELLDATAVLALGGVLYGALKALAQSRVRLLLAYANLSFFSILWWYVAATRTAPPQAAVYLAAVGLATGGFLLAWHAVQARYGDMDLRAIRGLAYPMPRFSTLLFLLTLAAAGLPPFGVFAGFMGMLLTPSLPLSGALFVIVVAWLAASWYFLGLSQRLLFGRHRPDLRYEDLRRTEAASLLVILLLLTMLGLVPAGVWESGTPVTQARAAVESPVWNR